VYGSRLESINADASIPNRIFSILKAPTASSFIFGLGSSNKVMFWDGADINNFSNTITTGTWYHLASAYNGTSTQLYFNGEAIDSPITHNLTIGSADYSNIGSDAQISGNYFDGKIKNLKIYNRALSAGEVLKLYDRGR